MADDPAHPSPPPQPEYKYVLKIITRDGKDVYTIGSEQLIEYASHQEIHKAGLEVHALMDLEAPIAHRPDSESIGLFGTFIINLSAYKPRK